MPQPQPDTRDNAGHIKATVYARIDPVMFTAVFDLAALANLSMATTIEALIAKAAGARHPYQSRLNTAIAKYRKGERAE